MFGGAALNDQVGNTLAAQGVSLYTLYGMTEVGIINTFARRELAYYHRHCNMCPLTWLLSQPGHGLGILVRHGQSERRLYPHQRWHV